MVDGMDRRAIHRKSLYKVLNFKYSLIHIVAHCKRNAFKGSIRTAYMTDTSPPIGPISSRARTASAERMPLNTRGILGGKTSENKKVSPAPIPTPTAVTTMI